MEYSSTPILHLQHSKTDPSVSDLPARLPSSRGGWGPKKQVFHVGMNKRADSQTGTGPFRVRIIDKKLLGSYLFLY